MEVFNLMTGKINESKLNWSQHCCGIVGRKENDFLFSLADEVNTVFDEELKRVYDKSEWWPEFQVWLYNREMPLQLVDTDKYQMLAVRNTSYYISKSGAFNIWKSANFKEKIVERVSSIINDDTISIDEEIKINACMFMLKHMDIKVNLEEEEGKCTA